MLTIACRYLTGRVVAASDADREIFAYPPQPARLMMALTAAAHEGHAEQDEFKMLTRLEAMPPPTIDAPAVCPREVKTVFVPINDKVNDPWNRSKQPRFFPSAHIGDAPVRFIWPEETLSDAEAASLSKLLGRVVRLGHSSSLVQMWLDDQHKSSQLISAEQAKRSVYVPDARGEHRFRITRPGTIGRLQSDFNGKAIERYAELSMDLEKAKTTKQRKLAKERQQQLAEEFPDGLPTSRRPVIRTTQGYREQVEPSSTTIVETVFDPAMISLAQIEGNTHHLLQTLHLTRTLRQALISHLGNGRGEVPSWISGHAEDGGPTSDPHIAFLPLPHVGDSIDRMPSNDQTRRRLDVRRTRVDGHLLGLGMVIPRTIEDDRRGLELASFLVEDDGTPKGIRLYGNHDESNQNSELELQFEDRIRPPRAIIPETWTRPSRYWATVTPIVLDRHPQADSRRERAKWRAEVTSIIARACANIGIDQQPIAVDLGRHGFLAGVPSAYRSAGQRTGSFPLFSDVDGKRHRMQLHALLEFKNPIRGPVILGAGRFRGYGFCKPIQVRN
ncbi:CRISPR-associated protein, family (Cas_GSU0054) [Stieleria maiorica]|uniref:CRISPR-associated protein, family (Cas_GSU0054) n=1 Tax=Stieleria maiorica TaxID=2795974 RepID=A0A5B9M9S9_9BACT|nr:type I-U CRISPR-associated protein Csb2 [Stieleria maiorica]QEF97868.1 CRISPR-associated protein, family (Cas_GSU0054) [Stieleria maiorica]